ncbi:uncharacterized protein BX664DRAFT_19220 [Halteromyces radiatus]|uniref:uncharacterized protein n=1 Tax=Halteromyces radiatus TaxID=101107 RepID=UPI00221EA5FB|nr:uncharacterized protein BX664DRAFT_19220 [Halteromyces radiatus]KAI8099353.1 hypothetical protein BX664DRAFT_19220 [Halteromyces radiatus]
MLAVDEIKREQDMDITMDNAEDQMISLNIEQQVQKEKHDWINQLRLKFCIRPEFDVTKNIIHPDGQLNQKYFRPPKGYKAELTSKRKQPRIKK